MNVLGEALRTTGQVAGAALACLALGLLGVSSAGAAPTWLAPVKLAGTATPTNPDVAVDASGDVTAVWDRFDGITYEAQAATRPAGEAWQAAMQISAPGEEAFRPHLAVNPRGYAVATWGSDPGGAEHHIVKVAVRPTASGAWSAPQELAEAGYPTPESQVAVDAEGNAVVVWASQLENPGSGSIQAATLPAGGIWSAPISISGGNSAGQPRLVVDAHGDFTAIWGGFDAIESAVKRAGATGWEAPSVLSNLWTGSPTLATNANGEAVAAWVLALSNSQRRIQGAVKPAGGFWGAPTDLSAVEAAVGPPDVAIDPQGDATAVWSAAGGVSARPVIQAAVRPAASAWQAPTELSETETPEDGNPQVALDLQGTAVVVWWGRDAGNDVIESSTRPAASAAWGTPVALSGMAAHRAKPMIALDPQGNAVAVWELDDTIQAAGYDTAGPQLRAFSIPSTGVVGQQLTFSVAPLDVWSPLGASTWNFGDGTSASGTTLTHTYAKPGAYQVTLSSADAIGNTTVASDPITISSTQPPSMAPTITNATQSAAIWREGTERTGAHYTRTSRPPVGTKFSFTLNERADVTFTFTQIAHGRKVTGRCVTQTKRNRRRHPCKQTMLRGRLSFPGLAGHNAVHFQGRISRATRLRPGRYELTMTARNAAGRTAQPKVLKFVIVG